jgi:tRNA threonylcarbamoyladenosine biosynthesis protein TsaE
MGARSHTTFLSPPVPNFCFLLSNFSFTPNFCFLISRFLLYSTAMTNETVITDSVDATQALAKRLASTLRPGSILALHGDLGSGKTCFVTGVARALEIPDAITSPTFTMINEYSGVLPLCHMDLYRITDPDELFTLGLDDYFDADGVTVIEWAERAGDLLPETTIHIIFEVLDALDARRITIESPNNQESPT